MFLLLILEISSAHFTANAILQIKQKRNIRHLNVNCILIDAFLFLLLSVRVRVFVFVCESLPMCLWFQVTVKRQSEEAHLEK